MPLPWVQQKRNPCAERLLICEHAVYNDRGASLVLGLRSQRRRHAHSSMKCLSRGSSAQIVQGGPVAVGFRIYQCVGTHLSIQIGYLARTGVRTPGQLCRDRDRVPQVECSLLSMSPGSTQEAQSTRSTPSRPANPYWTCCRCRQMHRTVLYPHRCPLDGHYRCATCYFCR